MSGMWSDPGRGGGSGAIWFGAACILLMILFAVLAEVLT